MTNTRYTLGAEFNGEGVYQLYDSGASLYAYASKVAYANICNTCDIVCGTFYDGIFTGGTFYGGCFYGGVYTGGMFHDGDYFTGVFSRGSFNGGDYYGWRDVKSTRKLSDGGWFEYYE